MNTIIHIENAYRCPTCGKVSTQRPRRIGQVRMCEECIREVCGEKYLRDLEAAERQPVSELKED